MKIYMVLHGTGGMYAEQHLTYYKTLDEADAVFSEIKSQMDEDSDDLPESVSLFEFDTTTFTERSVKFWECGVDFAPYGNLGDEERGEE